MIEESRSWHSYPSIYALGHRAIADLLTVDVNVEEKVDGSQFSFGVIGGALRVRSKGVEMHPDAPEKMFNKAVDTARDLMQILHPDWTYRAEYLAKPKHNTLAYDRAPQRHLIVFDVNTGHESYMGYEDKAREAKRIGLEVVPLLFSGRLTSLAEFRPFLDTISVLGGQKIEGVVVKPASYNMFGLDKKVLLGKFVSEAFKEIHGKEWKSSNPKQGDILDVLASEYQSAARWQKAVQHLQERGALDGSLRDIGALMKEVPEDIKGECEQEIKDKLFAWAWPYLRRRVSGGLPEWYKERLLAQQFE